MNIAVVEMVPTGPVFTDALQATEVSHSDPLLHYIKYVLTLYWSQQLKQKQFLNMQNDHHFGWQI